MAAAAATAAAAVTAAETLAGKANKFWPKIPGAKSTFHADARVNLPSSRAYKHAGYINICPITYTLLYMQTHTHTHMYIYLYIFLYSCHVGKHKKCCSNFESM